MTPTSEQLEQLSAYLDNELPPPERAMVESRLSVDAMLRGELESLRRTVTAVRGMPRVTAPASIADEVTERLARRELLGDGNARRAGEVVRFATFLRRFAVAAVLVLAAGVGWRYWSASSNQPVIGKLAAPTVAVPDGARPMPAPERRGAAPIGGLAKTELAARKQDRDAATMNERAEPGEGGEKLAFGNQLPGAAVALDTRAKVMGAGGQPGFSTRADAMLPTTSSPAMAKLASKSPESTPSASMLGSLEKGSSGSLATPTAARPASDSRAAEFGVSSRFSFGTKDEIDNPYAGIIATQVGTALIHVNSDSANELCQKLIVDAYIPAIIDSAAPNCPLASGASQPSVTDGLHIELRGRRSAVARYLIASARSDSQIELKLAPVESIVQTPGFNTEIQPTPQNTFRASDVVNPQPNDDPIIQVAVAVLPVISDTPSTSHAP